MIEILQSGGLTTVQDTGRRGHARLGIGRAGALDDLALRVGNRLLGNPPQAAGLEILLPPFRARVDVDTDIAVTGAGARLQAGGKRLPPWSRITLAAGEELALEAPMQGQAVYLCVRGGISVPVVLGSSSTDLKFAFGGLEGRPLCRGDRFQVPVSPGALRACAVAPPEMPALGASGVPGVGAATPLRFLPGMEWSRLGTQRQRALTANHWRVSRHSNRIGFRLEGDPIPLERPLEMLSHGVLPGLIQLPPAGEPIVLLCDAQTVGGYPRLGVVIEQDLRRLAQTPVGQRVRFRPCTPAQATEAEAEAHRWFADFSRWLEVFDA
ncbi:MAG: biotin-dependent carboxyltransferase family protein [Salinicola sp.]|uniref:5-oxoprolinase subunit C family protein n=1 Tax=Salinicola sp. TaxID=1978524 RepID=UPI001D54B63D|nr:biotin-dependent carboxyltransferase family protein [Salinicola sp.]NRB54452.1 biotin-dependent carboxyltransferase family protein [Salinicola sp.]